MPKTQLKFGIASLVITISCAVFAAVVLSFFGAARDALYKEYRLLSDIHSTAHLTVHLAIRKRAGYNLPEHQMDTPKNLETLLSRFSEELDESGPVSTKKRRILTTGLKLLRMFRSSESSSVTVEEYDVMLELLHKDIVSITPYNPYQRFDVTFVLLVVSIAVISAISWLMAFSFFYWSVSANEHGYSLFYRGVRDGNS